MLLLQTTDACGWRLPRGESRVARALIAIAQRTAGSFNSVVAQAEKCIDLKGFESLRAQPKNLSKYVRKTD